MTPSRPLIALLSCALTSLAWGQPAASSQPSGSTPDESWREYNGPRTTPPPPPPDSELEWAPPPRPERLRPDGGVSPPPMEADGVAEVAREALPSEPPNDVSIFGAPTLGQRRGGFGAELGFPYLSARLVYGVLPRVDVGVSFETVYGAFSDVRALVRARVLQGGGWTLGALVDGGPGFFTQAAQAESHGLRWLTGRRNWNLAPGLVVSYQAGHPGAARMFIESRFALAFDTEPYQHDPLGGVPAAVQTSWNVPLRLGAEFPYSRWTSILFNFGFDFHFRPDDSAVMPMVGIGLVTSVF